jgi:hypothetical protein
MDLGQVVFEASSYFSLREVSTMGPFTSEEEHPCSNTGERGRCEETSDRDLSDGGDPDGTNGGVLVSLGDGLPSLEGE